MGYYSGGSLTEIIQQGGLPVDVAINYATQVATGLAAARRAGIVHRDIKPAKVMLSAEGILKLVDFGLAKVAGHVHP